MVCEEENYVCKVEEEELLSFNVDSMLQELKTETEIDTEINELERTIEEQNNKIENQNCTLYTKYIKHTKLTNTQHYK